MVLEFSGLVFSDSCGAIQALRKLRVLKGSGALIYSSGALIYSDPLGVLKQAS